MRLTAAFGLAVFFLLGLPLLVSAAAPSVVIAEVMWDGVEYVELVNTTAETISFDGWTLTRQQAGGAAKTIVFFGEEDIIAVGAYFLIEKKEEATSIAADKVVSALTLVNTGELVTLLNAAGAVVDQANQSGAWYAGENTTDGVAMERADFAADGTEQASWFTSTGSVGGREGTPGEKNSVPKTNHPPEAVISGATTGLVGEEITFSAEDSSDANGDDLVFSWSLGDGSAASGADIAHTYTAAGNYSVRATVSDGDLEDEAELAVKVSAPVYSEAVVINEFLPNPAGADSDGEFIELKNAGGASVDLAGWQLDDADGGSTPYTIADGVTLSAGSLRSFSRAETKIALNNSGDTARLLDPSGEVKSSFVYSATVPEGQSYNRSGADFVLSTTATPGVGNVISQPADEEEEEDDAEAAASPVGTVAGEAIVVVDLKDIREEETGTMVETEGVISAPPGVLGDKILYLAGSGVQVYFYAEEYPELKLGDKVKVRGELGTALGEYRVKLAQASDIEVVDTAESPVPHHVQTGEVDEVMEGSLVIVEGKVTKTSGNTFYLDDGSGETKIFIKDSTEIDKPAMKKGVEVTITGALCHGRAQAIASCRGGRRMCGWAAWQA
jgi:PKD repeat protein